MIRHAVVFILGDGISDEEALRAKEGMAYCYYGSEVLALDFGADIGLEAGNYDLGLTHDHRDRAAWDTYNKNGTHHRVGEYIKTITKTARVARVDWMYDGPASTRGIIRHMAMYRWGDGVDNAMKRKVSESLRSLPSACPTVRWLGVGQDLLWYPTNHDWIVEAHFDDVDGLKAFLEHPAQREAEQLVAASTKTDAARFQHRMLAG